MSDLEPIGELHEERGEFWIENPWKMNNQPVNVSGYEPNQIFLNLGDGTYAEIGHLTSADSDGDGRGAMVTDVDGDLQPDLLVRQSGGGPLRIYANRFPPTSRLVVSLEGTESNRIGIGAILTARAGDLELTRQMFPTVNFASSQPAEVRFGLGDATRVDELSIRWPSGATQQLADLPVGAHIRVTEGSAEYDVLHRAPR